VVEVEHCGVERVGAAYAPLRWRARAKDGADLPAHARAERPARLGRFGVGETYDFEWTPARALDAVLSVEIEGQTRRLPVADRVVMIGDALVPARGGVNATVNESPGATNGATLPAARLHPETPS